MDDTRTSQYVTVVDCKPLLSRPTNDLRYAVCYVDYNLLHTTLWSYQLMLPVNKQGAACINCAMLYPVIVS